MDEMENTMIGRGRDAIEMIVDAGSFDENKIGTAEFDPDYGPGAVVGTAKLKDETVTVIANDAYAFNDRFPVVFGGSQDFVSLQAMAQECAGDCTADYHCYDRMTGFTSFSQCQLITAGRFVHAGNFFHFARAVARGVYDQNDRAFFSFRFIRNPGSFSGIRHYDSRNAFDLYLPYY